MARTGLDRPRVPTMALLSAAVLCTAGAGVAFIGTDDPREAYRALRLAAAGLAGLVLLWRGVRIINLWVREVATLLVLLWGYVTMFWSIDFGTSALALGGFVSVMIVATALVVELGTLGAAKLVSLVLSSCSAASLVVIYALPEVGTVWVRHPSLGLRQQAIGVFGWNSDLAFGAGIAVLLLAGLWLQERRPHQVVLTVVNLAVMGIAGSVTSTLAALAGLGVLAMFLGPLARRAVIAAALALGLSVFTVGIEPIAGPLFETFQRSADMTGRTQIWAATIHFIGERPLLGHGVGANPNFIQYLGSEVDHAHNGYLQVAYDRGLIGLAAFGGLVAVTLTRLRRAPTAVAVLTLPAMCAVLAANFANDYLTSAGLGVLMLVLAAMAAVSAVVPVSDPQVTSTRLMPTRTSF